MKWFRVLTTMMAAINDGSLLRFEYVLAENKILRKQNPGPVKMTDADRRTLAEIGRKLGRQALKEIGSISRGRTGRGGTAGSPGRSRTSATR